MSAPETTPSETSRYEGRVGRSTDGVAEFAVGFLRELVLLNAFVGWFLLWGTTAFLNYQEASYIGAGLTVLAVILPVVVAYLWYLGVVATDFGVSFPWETSGNEAAAS